MPRTAGWTWSRPTSSGTSTNPYKTRQPFLSVLFFHSVLVDGLFDSNSLVNLFLGVLFSIYSLLLLRCQRRSSWFPIFWEKKNHPSDGDAMQWRSWICSILSQIGFTMEFLNLFLNMQWSSFSLKKKKTRLRNFIFYFHSVSWWCSVMAPKSIPCFCSFSLFFWIFIFFIKRDSSFAWKNSMTSKGGRTWWGLWRRSRRPAFTFISGLVLTFVPSGITGEHGSLQWFLFVSVCPFLVNFCDLTAMDLEFWCQGIPALVAFHPRDQIQNRQRAL